MLGYSMPQNFKATIQNITMHIAEQNFVWAVLVPYQWLYRLSPSPIRESRTMIVIHKDNHCWWWCVCKNYAHYYSWQVGKCNMCGCNNGRLTCTDIEECEDEGEEDDDKERRCERCQDAPQRLVCGRDGRTFRSRCHAMNCSGLSDIDVLDGPCSSQVSNACMRNNNYYY